MNNAKRYIRRLYMKTDYKPFNPFLHAFVLKTLAFGIMYTFFAWTEDVNSTILYNLTDTYLPSFFGNLWGIFLLVVVVGHVCEMLFRGKGIGAWVGVAGFMAWLYAAWVYLITDQWYAFIAIVAMDLLLFWPWYYFSAKAYRRDLKAKRIPPVS